MLDSAKSDHYPKFMENKFVVWALLLVGAFLLISGIVVGSWISIVLGLISFSVGAKSKFGKK